MTSVKPFIVTTILLIFLQVELVKSKRQARIVNGWLAKPGEFPYQISLQRNKVHYCGGTIINPNFVLTAAHCVHGIPQNQFKVVAGLIDFNNLNKFTSVYFVRNIIVHEQYSAYVNDDIALINVYPPIQYNKYIAPAVLPQFNEPLNNNQAAIVSGFGKIYYNREFPSHLIKTYVYFVDYNFCQYVYSKYTIRDTHICVNNPYTETGFCNGDSGGPLTVNGKVVGIVSYSLTYGCAKNVGTPQILTRISQYINWIHAHIY